MDADNVKKEYLDFFSLYHNPEGFQKLYQIVEEIIKITLSPQIGSSFFINGLICRFLDTLSDPSLFHLANIQVDLLKTDLSISEIIAQLKFTNKSHFYKLFYAKHHMSPKEFRSKYRKD